MPSSSDPVLRLRDVRVGYGREVVLDAVDFEMAAGESWFVIGPNGSGKTTLLRTILGLIPPLSGELWRSPRHAVPVRVGFVPQACTFSTALPTTVREFVSLGAIGSDRPREGRADDLAWALTRVGLNDMESKSYWSLSGGQRQRALVARALLRRPALLVLDEPTEGLDIGAEEAFLRTLDDLSRESGTTLLVVTHRLPIALRHASHVALVHAGSVESGALADVLSEANIARVFGSSLGALRGYEMTTP